MSDFYLKDVLARIKAETEAERTALIETRLRVVVRGHMAEKLNDVSKTIRTLYGANYDLISSVKDLDACYKTRDEIELAVSSLTQAQEALTEYMDYLIQQEDARDAT